MAHNCFKVLLLLLLYITLPVVSVGLLNMVAMCHDYRCYFYIKNLPVLIATTPVYLITLLLLILYLRCIRNTRAGKWYLNKTLAVTQLVFAKFLKKKPDRNNEEEKEEGEKKVFIIFGHEASLKEMRWLFVILVQATLLAFAEFWDEFLLEETYSCSTHPRVHCFSSQSGRHINCSDRSNTYWVICYKYVFNTGHAAASAIGIISATGLIIYIVGLVYLKVLNGIRSHKRLTTCMKLLAVAEIVMFCQILAFLPMMDTIFTATDATLRSFCKTLTMNIMIVSSIISFPWNKFTKSEYEQLRDA